MQIIESGCWEWTASEKTPGYGSFNLNGKCVLAHRASYELHVGPIPQGLVLDHLCRNTLCVNPEHLEPVTARENIVRGESVMAYRAAQTHCIHGHELTLGNTYARPGGRRECRACWPARRAS